MANMFEIVPQWELKRRTAKVQRDREFEEKKRENIAEKPGWNEGSRFAEAQ